MFKLIIIKFILFEIIVNNYVFASINSKFNKRLSNNNPNVSNAYRFDNNFKSLQQSHDAKHIYEHYQQQQTASLILLQFDINNNNNNNNINNSNNTNDFMQFNPDDVEELIQLYNDVKTWREIFITVGAFITICGLILNTLCIIIFYKSKLFRNSSFPYYVYVLSIIDTFNLIIRYVVPQATEKIISNILLDKYNATTSGEYEIYTLEIVSDLHCNIFMYIHNTLGFASTWLMAAVSVERWLVIKYPLQSKHLINLRAYLILISILIVVLIINVFDLAPDMYSKPQWFSNLTLLCEAQDEKSYVKLAALTINPAIYSFIRTLLQAVGPFLVALFFNSLIIHNFKRIKSAAYRVKSNSSFSVMSPSHSSNASRQASPIIHSPRHHHHHHHIHHFHHHHNQYHNQHHHNHQSHSISNGISANGLDSVNTKQITFLQKSQLYGSTLMPPSSQPNLEQLTNISNSNTNLSLNTNTNGSTNVTQKYSFKRRLSKLRLNRETDIMLIVLSFSILFTQLPCTIAWYLIYYRLILQSISDKFVAAHTPVLMYILRLIEMLYFSLNFIFYITLSPSLRKELKLNPSAIIDYLLIKFKNKGGNMNNNNTTTVKNENKSRTNKGSIRFLREKYDLCKSTENGDIDKNNIDNEHNSNKNDMPMRKKVKSQSVPMTKYQTHHQSFDNYINKGLIKTYFIKNSILKQKFKSKLSNNNDNGKYCRNIKIVIDDHDDYITNNGDDNCDNTYDTSSNRCNSSENIKLYNSTPCNLNTIDVYKDNENVSLSVSSISKNDVIIDDRC